MGKKTIAGKEVDVDGDGFLSNLDDWNEEIAKEIAKEEGITSLDETHWKVINFMREDFKLKGAIPTLRRLKNASGVGTKEIYAHFPDGPSKKAAKIAGLGKPKGCI